MARTIKDESAVQSRVTTLRSRHDRSRRVMESLDLWRYRDAAGLYSEIWGDTVPENAARWTIIKPDIAATTETVIAFATTKRPKITATPKNTVSVPSADAANQVERIGYAIHDTIDRDRDVSWLREIFDHNFHRGAMVTKVLRLSPEERGAVTETIEPLEFDDPELESDEEPYEVVVSEDRFPILVMPVDPYECAWLTAPDGRLVEFAHEYDEAIDVVLAMFPDLEDHKDFKGVFGDWMYRGNATVKVTDYWTETQHCILINNTFYKPPSDHGYPGIPVVVDLAAPRTRRYSDRGQHTREGTPFCVNMIDSIARLSMAESWMTANMEEVAFQFLVHQNIDPDESPWMKQGDNGVSDYAFNLEMGPSKKVVPLFANKHGGEKMMYPELPPAAPAIQQYAMARLRDSSLVTFPESILSGAQTADLSGYAYAQMKQAAFARLLPHTLSGNRHASRVIQKVVDLIVHDWDRGPDIPLALTTLVGQRQQGMQEVTLEITKETFEAVGNIRVEIQPDLPVDLEKEWTMFFQAAAQGFMSARSVMNKMGEVEDPSVELEDIIAERFAMEDPQARAGILAKWMKRNGYQTPAPKPQPPMAAPPGAPAGMSAGAPPPSPMGMGAPPMGDPMAAMAGGMPPGMAPQMAPGMGPGMPPGGPPMGGGELPPEILMALQQAGMI